MVVINNSTSKKTPNALNQIKELYSNSKPVIIVAHVQFDFLVDAIFTEL